MPIQSQTNIKDSVNIRDSIVTKEVINKKDSVVTRDSVVIVVDDNGNVLRTEVYRLKEIYKDLQKEYTDLQAKYNSLLYQKKDSIQVPYPVERELSRWEQIKIEFGGIFIGVLGVILLIGIFYILHTRK